MSSLHLQNDNTEFLNIQKWLIIGYSIFTGISCQMKPSEIMKKTGAGLNYDITELQRLVVSSFHQCHLADLKLSKHYCYFIIIKKLVLICRCTIYISIFKKLFIYMK